VKGNSYRALNHFERFKEVPLEWSKETDNWRVALEMNVDELLSV